MIRRYNDDDDGEVIGHARGVIVPDGGRVKVPMMLCDDDQQPGDPREAAFFEMQRQTQDAWKTSTQSVSDKRNNKSNSNLGAADAREAAFMAHQLWLQDAWRGNGR